MRDGVRDGEVLATMIDFVSIVIPFFRAGRFVENIVRSLSCQAPECIGEVVVVDDGRGIDIQRLITAAAGTSIAEKYRFVSTLGQQGPARARNLGLQVARGRYVAFLDCDDSWRPEFLAVMVAEMRARSVPVLVCEVEFRKGANATRLLLPAELTFGDMLQTNPIAVPAVFVDRRDLVDFRFPEHGHEDYALWLAIATRVPAIGCVQMPLVVINRVEGSVSSRKARAASWHWRVLGTYSSISVATRCALFALYAANAILKRIRTEYRPLLIRSRHWPLRRSAHPD